MEPTGSEPQVTVIVATRDRADDVPVVARSILAGDLDLELLVIDQSEDQRTAEAVAVVAGEDPRIRYVRSDRPGKTRAMNLGLDQARAPLVLFTDDDCEVEPGWVEAMAAELGTDDRVGAVFSRVVAGPHDEAAGFVPHFPVPERRVWTSGWRLANPEMGAAMGVRRPAVEAIGGFDEQMGPGGRFPSADDTDIANRLLAAGWHVIDTDRTEVVHHGFRTFAQGRELTRRDWIALGAAFGKAARCRLWGAVANGAWLAFRLGLVDPLVEAAGRRTRPTGLRRSVHFAHGFGQAYASDVDRRTMRFR